jgi:hypothetical protein
MNSVMTLPSPASLRGPAQCTPPHAPTEPSIGAFGALLCAFRPTGGTARGDDLSRLLDDCHCRDSVSLATLLASGAIFGFAWHNTVWIPMFQFDLRDLSIRSSPRQVRAELTHELDGWGLASWFGQPNCWLSGRRPVDVLESDRSGVLGAARADRFIAVG